jgi:hypothetical protein
MNQLTPKERGILRRQNKHKKTERQQSALTFCFKDLRHCIMQHLNMFDQIQLNKSWKAYYIPIDKTIPNHNNLFRAALASYRNWAVKPTTKAYNPLTKVSYHHERSVMLIKELSELNGILCQYDDARRVRGPL